MRKEIIILLAVLGVLGVGAAVCAQEGTQQAATSTEVASATTTNTNTDSLVPLVTSATTVTAEVPQVNLKPGVRNAYVKKLQQILKDLKYLPQELQITDYLGPKTKEALMKLQKEHGLPAVGQFGPATRNLLKRLIQERKEVLDITVDIACMKTAVEKRETALLDAYKAYSTKIQAAYETRKNDLLAAWSITDAKERQTAVKNAWNKYHQSVKTAFSEWKKSEKTAWSEFLKEAKNCKATAVETQDLEKVETEE